MVTYDCSYSRGRRKGTKFSFWRKLKNCVFWYLSLFIRIFTVNGHRRDCYWCNRRVETELLRSERELRKFCYAANHYQKRPIKCNELGSYDVQFDKCNQIMANSIPSSNVAIKIEQNCKQEIIKWKTYNGLTFVDGVSDCVLSRA